MSKPLENYIIRIKSSIDQFDNEGVIREEDRDHIELMTRGSFTKKNGSYYISYKETQTIGFEGCTTTIKIAEDGSRVALLRFGRANSQLLIERDRRNLCHYEFSKSVISSVLSCLSAKPACRRSRRQKTMRSQLTRCTVISSVLRLTMRASSASSR